MLGLAQWRGTDQAQLGIRGFNQLWEGAQGHLTWLCPRFIALLVLSNFLYECNKKSNFDCIQEQENFVLKSMKLKVVVLKIFHFGPKMVKVVKRLFEQSQLLLKLLKSHLRCGSELDTPEICHWDAQPQIPTTGKLPLVWRAPQHCTATESCP